MLFADFFTEVYTERIEAVVSHTLELILLEKSSLLSDQFLCVTEL